MAYGYRRRFPGGLWGDGGGVGREALPSWKIIQERIGEATRTNDSSDNFRTQGVVLSVGCRRVFYYVFYVVFYLLSS